MTADEFWKIVDMLDWKYADKDDEKILKPAVTYLASCSDEDIFAFDEIMSKLLYDIDGDQWYTGDSGDVFLYERCIALVNGKQFYDQVKAGKQKLDPDMEFESLLTLPGSAWALKHGASPDDYRHFSKYSYESFSNVANWKHLNDKYSDSNREDTQLS
ncbi:hypothetical protein KIM372_08220 [Bombiscardovia nodaiensis]|uniref:DUF4240 domain-containing protein n=1 Tax=Bombiscardovia nodaiensis TaxID=2932181 RepID=A0ABM8B7R3_9BIFI|nr:hypothetical protein KIM372_08220 [Bombiscardovia nodaiensis]